MKILKSINYKGYSLVCYTNNDKEFVFVIMDGTVVLYNLYSNKILSDTEMIDRAKSLIEKGVI